MSRRTDQARAAAVSLLEQARSRLEDGQPDAAERLWDAALQLGHQARLPDVIANAQLQLAAFDLRRKDLDRARARLDEALPLARRLARDADEQAPLAAVAGRLGQVLLFQGEPHNGVALMRESMAAWQDLGRAQQVRELELAVEAVRARVEAAVEDAADEPVPRAHALYTRARVRLACEETDAGLADLSEAWSLVQDSQRSDAIAVIGTLYGQVLLAVGRAGATEVLRAARRGWLEEDNPEQVEALDEMIARATEALEP